MGVPIMRHLYEQYPKKGPYFRELRISTEVLYRVLALCSWVSGCEGFRIGA